MTDVKISALSAASTLTGTEKVPVVQSSSTVMATTQAIANLVNLSSYATLASPTFTGTPTLPTGTIATTQTAGDSSTKLATTAFVTTADNLKANLASPTFTGTPTLPTGTIGVTQTAGNSSTALATTAFVTTADNLKLSLSGGTMTGNVKLLAQTETTITNATVTGAVTIPVTTGTTFNYTLTGATTFTFGSPSAGSYSMTMLLKQDATGSRVVTWPSSTTLKWAGGSAPTLSTAANAVDIVTIFTPDGTTWYGALSGKAFA